MNQKFIYIPFILLNTFSLCQTISHCHEITHITNIMVDDIKTQSKNINMELDKYYFCGDNLYKMSEKMDPKKLTS